MPDLAHDNAELRKRLAEAEARALAAEGALERALNELGVPQPGYPAPVANAVEILRAALASPPEAKGEGK